MSNAVTEFAMSRQRHDVVSSRELRHLISLLIERGATFVHMQLCDISLSQNGQVVGTLYIKCNLQVMPRTILVH
jgi:hypothetical protein